MSLDMDQQYVINMVSKIVEQELDKRNLLKGNWQLGKVDSVISSTRLKVFINGSSVSQEISCNPDVNFQPGNHVWVIYANGSLLDKFVLCRRGI